MDFLDFIARQIIALLRAAISAALSLSWQPLERFIQSAGGGGGGVLLLLALLAAGSLLLLGVAVIFYLRRRHRQTRPEPSVRSQRTRKESGD